MSETTGMNFQIIYHEHCDDCGRIGTHTSKWLWPSLMETRCSRLQPTRLALRQSACCAQVDVAQAAQEVELMEGVPQTVVAQGPCDEGSLVRPGSP
jgi:hypothetical protein